MLLELLHVFSVFSGQLVDSLPDFSSQFGVSALASLKVFGRLIGIDFPQPLVVFVTESPALAFDGSQLVLGSLILFLNTDSLIL